MSAAEVLVFLVLFVAPRAIDVGPEATPVVAVEGPMSLSRCLELAQSRLLRAAETAPETAAVSVSCRLDRGEGA